MISGFCVFYRFSLHASSFFHSIVLTMPKAKNNKATLSSRLLQDSDEEEDVKHYKERDEDRGLSPLIKLELLKEFDAEGGIDKWTRKTQLLEKICAKRPDTFGSKANNPKLFKKTKNFAARYKGHPANIREAKRIEIIHQVEDAEKKNAATAEATTGTAAAKRTNQAISTTCQDPKTEQDDKKPSSWPHPSPRRRSSSRRWYVLRLTPLRAPLFISLLTCLRSCYRR